MQRMEMVLADSPGVFFNTFDLLHGTQQNQHYNEQLFEYISKVVMTRDVKNNSQQVNLCLRLMNARLKTVRFSDQLSKVYADKVDDLLEMDYHIRLMQFR